MNPVGTHVLVELIDRAEQYAADLKKRSGLLMPTKIVHGMPDRGIVYGIGDEIENPEIAIGDMVIFTHQEHFQGFEHEGKKLGAIPYKDIRGIITEDEE